MFHAARALKVSGPIPSLSVYNAEGQFAGSDKGKAESISEWFKQQFTDPFDEPLHPFDGDPRPLEVPVKAAEVKKAVKSLKNGHSSGPDGINNELFKYASDVISQPIASIINAAYEQHVPIEAVGQGTLICTAQVPIETTRPPS